MARVSIYVNTQGQTEEAFTHYARTFGSQVTALQRFREIPQPEGMPPMAEADLDKVMHVEVEILGGLMLMGTDMLESMGQQVRIGNNTTINLEPDTYDEAQRLFTALSDGASDAVPLAPMFWGSAWGTCLDRFGIRWMFNAPLPSA